MRLHSSIWSGILSLLFLLYTLGETDIIMITPVWSLTYGIGSYSVSETDQDLPQGGEDHFQGGGLPPLLPPKKTLRSTILCWPNMHTCGVKHNLNHNWLQLMAMITPYQ